MKANKFRFFEQLPVVDKEGIITALCLIGSMHAITTGYDNSMCLQAPNAHHSHSNGSHICNITFEVFFYELAFSKCNTNIGKKQN